MAEGQKKFSMMMIVGLVVAGLLLAGGISYFIATKIVAERTADTKTAAREPGVFMKLGDAKDGLIVNIGGVSSGRYLKIGIVLELKPNKNAPAKEGKTLSPEEIKILDTTLFVLRSRKLADFDPSKQDALKDLIRSEVNKALGDERVYEVYITDFVLQ